jgi:hypothetical protein
MLSFSVQGDNEKIEWSVYYYTRPMFFLAGNAEIEDYLPPG